MALADDGLHAIFDVDGGEQNLVSFETDGDGEWSLRSSSRLDVTVSEAKTNALAFMGNKLLVGDPAHGDGRMLVYHWSDSDWSLAQVVAGPARVDTTSPSFGSAIVGRPGQVLVGAPGMHKDQGRVFIMSTETTDATDSGFELTDTLNVAAQEEDPRFGSALAIDGSTLIVGARDELFGYGAAFVFEHDSGHPEWSLRQTLYTELVPSYPSITGSDVPCEDGRAGGFSCSNVDIKSFLSIEALGLDTGMQLNDVWGWTDPETGKEYAIVCSFKATTFVDVTDPNNPVVIGTMDATPGSRPNWWRDAKVYKDYAYIVADNVGDHGLQIFDLSQLRNVENPPVSFSPSAHYAGFDSAHNIFINEESGFAYIVGINGGGNTCGGGSHILDLSDPLDPQFVGCFSHQGTGRNRQGASHDTQCVIYNGPDERFSGHEICVASNETAVSIADFTDKQNIVTLAVAEYPGTSYTHQGWFSEDQRYFYQNDETDEINRLTDGTRTLIWDLAELDDPVLVNMHVSENRATDHNYYVLGNYLYQSNYLAGLRILDISDPAHPVEVGYFDTVPWGSDRPGFGGSWSNFPFFKSGLIAVTSMQEGVFFLKRSEVTP
jgi:choice-of-anchor B domain-containing protein